MKKVILILLAIVALASTQCSAINFSGMDFSALNKKLGIESDTDICGAKPTKKLKSGEHYRCNRNKKKWYVYPTDVCGAKPTKKLKLFHYWNCNSQSKKWEEKKTSFSL